MLCRIAFTQNGLVFMEWKKRSNAWLSMYLVRLGGEGSQHPLLQHWMKIRITRRIFKRAMSESHSNQIKLESLRGILWKQWSYVIACTESWCTQLTLEHHGFELHGSTDTQIFFFSIHTIALSDQQTAESTDVDADTQGPPYFWLCEG